MTALKLTGAGETLERIGRLRHGVRTAITQAGETQRDFETRAARLRAQFEQACKVEQARLAEGMEAIRAEGEKRRARIEAQFQGRKARLQRALGSVRQAKMLEIDAEESRHTVAIQRDLLEADRAREADTAKNTANHDALVARLAALRTELTQSIESTCSSLGAYRRLRDLVLSTTRNTGARAPESDATKSETELIEVLAARLALAKRWRRQIRATVLPVLFRFLPVWLWAIVILGAAFAPLPALRMGLFEAEPVMRLAAATAALAVVFGLHHLGKRLARPATTAAAEALAEASLLLDACHQRCEAAFAAETERIRSTHADATQHANNQWKRTQTAAKKLREEWADRLQERVRSLHSVAEGRQRHSHSQVEQEQASEIGRLTEESRVRKAQIESVRDTGLAKLAAARDASWQGIESAWQSIVVPNHNALIAEAETATRAFPAWKADLWQGFRLPETFLHAARFSKLQVDLEALGGVRLDNERLRLPGASRFELPLLISMPECASLLFETKQSGREQVAGAFNNLILRLLTSAPPGRLEFTIFDPVGLGQTFAGLMHLADFEERLINSRIWTQQGQFEQRLGELGEHIEKVTQMYLRNEYPTLAEYNAQAGRLAEKYHFLVIADFPTNFSDLAVKRLMNIAASGGRCGVHLLLHWDQRRAAPLELVPEELRKNALCLTARSDGFAISHCPDRAPAHDASHEADTSDATGDAVTRDIAAWEGLKLTLDTPPGDELATDLLHQVGRDSIDSNRVETPFAEVAPGEGAFWSLDTTNELSVPVGRTGATKLQHLALGRGTRQHALVAGKTGSGKSTLFHVIVTNLALWCSPDQVEFYLVDFKKGVEFKCYASQKLPHARVIAIESDREFGLSVLQRVDEELKRRGDLFRKLGAQDIAGYKRAGGADRMPRVLLLIDEFQELFVEDDRVSQGAALLLDRIVRQGRAFGVHVILGSQTLGGAYTLARATIGQMVVRIALQCNEADAYLIMNEDNPAPRLLSRPGEAIYNDDAGSVQGNSPFQVVWLPDQIRDSWLAKAHELAAQRNLTSRVPVIFEGNAPADVRENPLLKAALTTPATQGAAATHVWLGAPNSIKGPTEALFRRASGNHLLIVGQREEVALAMVGVALVSIAAQRPTGAARFLMFDCSAPDSAEAKFLERVAGIIPHDLKLVRPGDVDEVMSALAAEQQQRLDSTSAGAAETYLLVHGLARNKKLRFDEEMSFSSDADASANPGLQFNKLICEGANLGFHVIATCDTYNNLLRMLSRKAVSEFEMRVVFQMSANDSASLIETPQANTLGLHRALFYNGQEGWLETFRPYALPDEAWLREAGELLKRREAGPALKSL
jgi:hypothetical protein